MFTLSRPKNLLVRHSRLYATDPPKPPPFNRKPAQSSTSAPPPLVKLGSYKAKVITAADLRAAALGSAPASSPAADAAPASKAPVSKAPPPMSFSKTPLSKVYKPYSKPIFAKDMVAPILQIDPSSSPSADYPAPIPGESFGLQGGSGQAPQKTRKEIEELKKIAHGFTPNSINYRLPANCLRVTRIGSEMPASYLTDKFSAFGVVEQIRFPPTVTDAYIMYASEKEAIAGLKALSDRSTGMAKKISEKRKFDGPKPGEGPPVKPTGPGLARAEIGNFERELSGVKKMNKVKEFQRVKKRMQIVHVADHYATRRKEEMIEIFEEYGIVQAVQPAVDGKRGSVIFQDIDDARACIADLDGNCISGDQHGPLIVKESPEELEVAVRTAALTPEQKAYLEAEESHELNDFKSHLSIPELTAAKAAIRTLEDNHCPSDVADDIFKRTATHRWGEYCRDPIANRMMSYLLRRVSKPNKDLLSQALLADFLALAEHETGNHVAQVLIKVLVKDEEKSQMVLDLVKPNVDKLLASKKGNYIASSVAALFGEDHSVLDALVKNPTSGYAPGVISRLLVDANVSPEQKTTLVNLVMASAKDLVHNHPQTAPTMLTWILDNNTSAYGLSLLDKVVPIAEIYAGRVEDLLIKGNFAHKDVLFALLHQRVSEEASKKIQYDLFKEGAISRLLKDVTGLNFIRGVLRSDGLQSIEKIPFKEAVEQTLKAWGEGSETEAQFHHIYTSIGLIDRQTEYRKPRELREPRESTELATDTPRLD